MEKKYLTCAETAKLIRKDLKANFPGVKFSVRSDTYSMGASIRVKYTDGPAEADVKAVTDKYVGAGFDGMIDLKFYYSHYYNTKTGESCIASCSGSGVSYESYENEMPEGDGWIPVSFGADHVFVSREITVEPMEIALAMVAKAWGFKADKSVVKDSEYSGAWIDLGAFVGPGIDWHDSGVYANEISKIAGEIATGDYMVKEAK